MSTTEGKFEYRVWPDGSVESVEDCPEPPDWKGDDYLIVLASDEEEAEKAA